jgi:hypothetical protein
VRPELDLFVVSADPDRAAEATAVGAAGVVVDWERRGKRQRQAGFDTQIGADTHDDLRRVRAATEAGVLCRLNGWGRWSPAELDEAVELGADEVLLPMVRRPEEVDRALEALSGRCGLGILVETVDAVRCIGQLAARPLTRVYVGLNDLMIDRGSRCLFEPLVDGTVDRLRSVVTCPFGVAGLTVPGGGWPVPSRLLAGELARLGADFTCLLRLFLADTAGRPLAEPMAATAAMAASARLRTADAVAAERREFVDAVAGFIAADRLGTGPAAAPADAAVLAGACPVGAGSGKSWK